MVEAIWDPPDTAKYVNGPKIEKVTSVIDPEKMFKVAVKLPGEL